MYVQWSPDGTAILAASGKLNGDEAPGEIVLWQQMADGTWVEQFRVENIQAHYPGSASALFNPGGNLVAFESLPRAEATEFQIFVYDRQQEEVILTLPEYRLAAWQSDELLLTAEAQYWVYLTQWQVRTGTKVVGNASGDGGHQYSPDGVFFAQFSHSGRNVEVRDWALNQLVARGQVVRINLLWIGWSPDGRFLATYAPDGTITLWPLNWTQ
jgi:WD40 repeat protein